MEKAVVTGKIDLEAVQEHEREVRLLKERSEFRRKMARIAKLNREAEGYEPGFHNRIKGLRALAAR